MLGRVADGTDQAAPRELIHLLNQTRDVQLQMLERGEDEPSEDMLFSRQAFRDALPEVSRVRLEQTVYAEYPHLRQYLEALAREKTQQSPTTLSEIWGVSPDEATRVAEELVAIGFFERRGSRHVPDYWVPFLYRSALGMVQGSAD
jgi:Fic family protein